MYNKEKIQLGFWGSLPHGFTSLAPMEDVTDTAFRQIVAKCGAPDVFFTEFTSCEGICSPGRENVIHRLMFSNVERPLVAQIWGKTLSAYEEATRLIVDMGFDGIDINMGCPVAKIVKQGCCSALINNPTLAVEIIEAVKSNCGHLPVSVKTRIGFNEVKTLEWTGTLLDTGIAALTVHGRIASEMSKVPADWDEVRKVVELRDSKGLSTLIVGNGDITTLSDAKEKIAKYKVDGVMVGRGIFSNPWFFNENVNLEEVTPAQRIDVLIEHLGFFREYRTNERHFQIMKKFFKIYINGFAGAVELRAELMETSDYDSAIEILRNWTSNSTN